MMHAVPELTLTSTYHPCNQVAGILRGHLASALKLLGAPKPSGSRIHAARQELKRARATLRLLRDSIDRDHFRQEDATLQQAAQQLNEVRDSDVLCRVFTRLRNSVKDEVPRANLEPLHKLLLQQRRTAASIALRGKLTAVRSLLLQAREQSRDWFVSNDPELLTRAMQLTYRKGRDGYRAVCESHADEQLHDWRRQVKYCAYQLEALGSQIPGKMARRLRRCAKLGKALGRDHDLAMLQMRIPDAHLDAVTTLRLTNALRRERAQLQRQALDLGKRLYRVKPRRFQPLS